MAQQRKFLRNIPDALQSLPETARSQYPPTGAHSPPLPHSHQRHHEVRYTGHTPTQREHRLAASQRLSFDAERSAELYHAMSENRLPGLQGHSHHPTIQPRAADQVLGAYVSQHHTQHEKQG